MITAASSTHRLVRHASAALHDVTLVDDLVDDLEQGHTVLLVALSGALLGTLVAHLRAAGVPHRDLTAPPPDHRLADALARYLALDDREQPATSREWTGHDVRAWWALCQPPRAGLRPSARTIVDALPATLPVPYALLADLWRTDVDRARALDPDPRWLLEAARTRLRARLAHLVAVAEHHGPRALLTPPRLLVGTAHAAHRAWADVVYLCPDLTAGQADEWWSGHRGRLARLVAASASRARREVVWLAQGSRYALPTT